MKLGVKVGLGTGHIVLDGNPAPPPKRGAAPQFSADICFGQMAGVIKMPLSMKVDLGPGDFVLDGDPAPPPQKGWSPHVYCGQTAGWIKMAVGTEVGRGRGHIVLDGDPAPPKKRPIFIENLEAGCAPLGRGSWVPI